MKFFRLIWQYKFSIIVLVSVFFLVGYFVTDYFYNANQARYVYAFSSEEEASFLLEENYYEKTFQKIDENNRLAETDESYKKVSYAKIDYSSMLKTADLCIEDGIYHLSVQRKFFANIVNSTSGKVNAGENRVKNYFNLLLSYSPIHTNFQEVYLSGNINPWLVGIISSGILFVFLIGVLFFYSVLSKQQPVIEDNVSVFTSIFHKKYWKESISFSKSVKKMCIVSILFGCMLICKFIPIPSGFGSLGLSFTYLFFGVICWIYGPVCGLFIGFCSDILGYFMQPGGIFFFGYTLDAMLAGLMYGICFYKKRITFANCFIARAFVNLCVNVGLGSIWWKIIYGLDWEAYFTYITLTSLPKNVLYLLPQSILLFLFFKAICKPLASFGLIEEKVSQNVKLF